MGGVIYILLIALESYYRNEMFADYLHRGNILLGIVVAISMVKCFILKGWILASSLSQCGFFIYLLHGPIVKLIRGVLLKVIPQTSDINMLAIYAFTFISVMAICYITYIIMGRYTPRLLNILCGNR